MIRLTHLLVVAAAVLVTAAPGFAQPGPRAPAGPRPAFSPYLNLARRDVPAGVNYYGLVRPQLAAQANIQQLQQQIAGLQQGGGVQPGDLPGAADPRLPTTGQPTYFLNT